MNFIFIDCFTFLAIDLFRLFYFRCKYFANFTFDAQLVVADMHCLKLVNYNLKGPLSKSLIFS